MSNKFCIELDKDQKGHEIPQVGVVVVPFPMQGHLNEILHLSCLITSYKIPLHFVGSTIHNHQAKLRLHGWNQQNLDLIKFHDFELPNFNSKPSCSTSNTKFPTHLQPLFDACSHLRSPIFHLFKKLSTKFRRLIVIHDSLMSSIVQDVKLISNVESFTLHCVSAFAMFFHVWEVLIDKPFKLDFDVDDQLDVPSIEGCFPPEFLEYLAKENNALDFESGRLYNTSRVIEGKYMELLSKLPIYANKRLFAIGPFNPVEFSTGKDRVDRSCLIEWLDEQENDSVLYVSFGTTTEMGDEQIRELALGLEQSGQKFIWVVRNADRSNIFSENDVNRFVLPKGYENRVKNRGIIVREWVPQLEILSHSSTGGFMTHCGWNSCMESISMGVPMATWPMHSDQPKNNILVTKVLNVGVCVRDWARRNELVQSRIVVDVVTRLMASKDGNTIRKRAREVGKLVRNSVKKDGASRVEFDSFISYISR